MRPIDTDQKDISTTIATGGASCHEPPVVCPYYPIGSGGGAGGGGGGGFAIKPSVLPVVVYERQLVEERRDK